MRLLLTSAGFTTDEIVNAFTNLCDKPKDQISIGIINEAYAVEIGDKRWSIEEQNRCTTIVGGNIDLINLLALDIKEIEKRVDAVDALYVVGGHTDYLMHIFNKSGFTKILPKILEKKVYVGSSAGAMVPCRRVSTEFYLQEFGEGENYGIKQYMNLVEFAIKPHLDSPNFPDRDAQKFKRAAKNYNGTIIGLRDDQAIMVDSEKTSHLGGTPLILNG